MLQHCYQALTEKWEEPTNHRGRQGGTQGHSCGWSPAVVMWVHPSMLLISWTNKAAFLVRRPQTGSRKKGQQLSLSPQKWHTGGECEWWCIYVCECLYLCYLAGERPCAGSFSLGVLDSTVLVGIKHSPCKKNKKKQTQTDRQTHQIGTKDHHLV